MLSAGSAFILFVLFSNLQLVLVVVIVIHTYTAVVVSSVPMCSTVCVEIELKTIFTLEQQKLCKRLQMKQK